MSILYQSEYAASEEVALNWWRSLPEGAISVCGLDEKSDPCDVGRSHFHQKNGDAVWLAWSESKPKERMIIGVNPLKDSSGCWKIDIGWWPSIKPVAEILEKTFISLGAVCTRFPVSST